MKHMHEYPPEFRLNMPGADALPERTEAKHERSVGDYMTFPDGFEMREVSIPGSSLVGAEVRLSKRAKMTGAEALTYSGMELDRMTEMLEVFKSRYAFVVVKGVELDNESIQALEFKRAEAFRSRKNQEFTTFDKKYSQGEQEMHHDGVIDTREVFSLYHPYPPYDGRTNIREAQTQVMDSVQYWSGVADFLLAYEQRVEAGQAQWPVDGYIVQSLLTALKNPAELDLLPRMTV